MKQLTVHYQELLDPLQVRSPPILRSVSMVRSGPDGFVETNSRPFPFGIIFQKHGTGIWLMLEQTQKLILIWLLQIQQQLGLQLLSVPMINLVLELLRHQFTLKHQSQGLNDGPSRRPSRVVWVGSLASPDQSHFSLNLISQKRWFGVKLF